jgi:hypothetical protein
MMMALSLAMMVPAVAMAQRPEARGPREGRQMPMRRPAGGVALMLENASALKLSDDQVTRLRSIQARYEERTAPLRARADSLRPDREGADARRDLDAAELRQRRQAAGEIMTLMREEGQSARTEAMALLSGDQQKKVQEIEEARRKERESRRGRRGPGGEGGRRGGGGGPPAA